MNKRYGCLITLSLTLQAGIATAEISTKTAIEQAREALASSQQSPKNLTVESANAVRWPDSSLGCPQPGMMYAQVITSGYRVIFVEPNSGKRHFVHLGAGRAIVCDKTESTRSQTEKSLRFGKHWQHSQKAQQLLADRLSVPRKEIRIIGARTIENKKAGSLCKTASSKEKPASSHLQVINLRYGNRTYQYGVIDNRLVFCD